MKLFIGLRGYGAGTAAPLDMTLRSGRGVAVAGEKVEGTA